MAERILNVNLETQSRDDSQAYAIYVARNRAIPDFIDGLKPVIRKILWCAAHDFGGQGFIKTANIVGQVMRKYNPHGDSGVNSAIRNMINDFSTKYPIMEGSGSWGTKVDPYAAQPRYNECKISQFAIDVFIQDIKEDKRATDWMANYDNKCYEPVYLPAKIPTLLILGQMGIGVGIKTTIPSHNLGDVIDVTIKLIHDPNAPFVLIPDECMPCEIMDTDWEKINRDGYGTYIAQGIIDIGEYEGKPCLIIRSLPDFTFYDKIDERIKALAKDGKMPFIVDVISRSGVGKTNGREDPKKYRFEEIIVLKKGTDPNFVREYLYANTNIRQTRQVNLIVIKNNNLASMGYREYLLEFINFRRMSVFRKLNARLQVLKTKIHETELYIKLLTSGHIDNVIQMIRRNKSADRSEIVDFLVAKLKVTPVQAKYLSKITLPELSAGYLQQCIAKMKVYNDEIKKIMRILLDPKKIDEVIIEEMLTIKAKYNDAKKCRIVSQSQIRGVASGTFKLVIMKNNFIKKMNETDMVPPSQMGKVNLIILADNAEDIIVFTALGKAFKIPVHKIPISDPNSDGTDVRLLNKYCTTNVTGVARETTLKTLCSSKSKNFIYTVTKQGFVKRIDIEDVINCPTSGIIYARVDPGDFMQAVLFGPTKMDILFYSSNKVIRLNSKEIPYLRRSTKGSRVSTTSTTIDGMNFILPQSTDLVVVTKKGYVNRIPVANIEKTTRGRAGLPVIRLSKGDEIHTIWTCTQDAKLIVREGRSQREIPVASLDMASTVSTGKLLFQDVTKVFLSY